ncbi:MAG TPA: hypothetical protein VFY18_06730 [Candidatus Limnocylindrales bacterium]|nr:hypothetical protein [Candidatus Limnocylindrales bacterium]
MTDRLATFLNELYRRNLDDLGMIALPEPDPVARGELLARATAAASAAGPDRLAELRRVPDRVEELVFRSYSFRGFEPSWFGLIWGRSIGRAADRARLVAAVEDAAVAEVVADLLPADDLADLREPFLIAKSMAGAAPGVNPTFTSRRVAGAVAGAWIVAVLLSGGAVIAGAIAGVLSRLRSRRDPEA